MSYDQLERRFIAWAQSQEPVRAAIVVGSRARPPAGAHPPDEWSDLDLILFVTRISPFVSDGNWLGALGEIWLAVPGHTGRGDPEWDVVYAGGDKVDFVLVDVSSSPEAGLQAWLEASPYRLVLERGVRVLVDKGRPGPADPAEVRFPFPPAPRRLPSPALFAGTVRQALLTGVRAARFLARGDLWRARQQVECVFMGHLLTMLEWHALAVRGPGTDTWYDGRYLGEWAHPLALAELSQTAAAYHPESLSKALHASLSLFQRLARETAGKLGVAYPQAEEERITRWINSILWKT
jgi:aminoglycoside 6-adenylyltransferase